MARKIVIASGKGGVGKTTVTANLGRSLASRSLRVALLDFDMGLNNLDVTLHVDQRVIFDLVDVVEGKCRVSQALIQDNTEPTLYIMPSCHQAKRIISVDAVKKLIAKMEDSYDYILIDCPAGIDIGFRRAVGCADECIVVATPHISSVRDASKALEYIDTLGLYGVSVVVNRVRGDLVSSGEVLSSTEIFSLLGHRALGVVPENDIININGTVESNPKDPFDMLADNLHNGNNNMYDCTSRYRGILGKFRSSIRRRV